MWPFKRHASAPVPRLHELDDRLLVVEKSIDWLKKSDRELNARISSIQRVQNRLEDAPGATIVPPPHTQVPPPDRALLQRPPPTTAVLRTTSATTPWTSTDMAVPAALA